MEFIKENANVLITMSEAQLEAYSTNLINKVLAFQLDAKKEDKLLTPDEAAKKMKIAKATLWRWEKQGYLLPTRVGGKVFYKESDIIKLMEG